MFNASEADTSLLFELLGPRIAKAQTLEPGHFWYIPSSPETPGQYVFWGPFDHGWRYRDWLGPPPAEPSSDGHTAIHSQGAPLAHPRR